MSVADEIGAVAGIATGNPLAWAHALWKVAPWALFAASTTGLAITRETLAGVRSDNRIAAADAKAASAQHDADQANRTTGAVQSFALELLGRAPVVLQATSTVREYANTAAGRVICAAPDVVRRTDALDAALFPVEGAAEGGAGFVPTDPAPPATGWLGRLLGRRADDRGRAEGSR